MNTAPLEDRIPGKQFASYRDSFIRTKSEETRTRWLEARAHQWGVSFEEFARQMKAEAWETHTRDCLKCPEKFTERRPPCCPPKLTVCERCTAKVFYESGTREGVA